MGRSVNKVTIIGTLGRDPEMKYMPNGNAVVNLSVATDESYNDKQSGQKVEKTEWHRLTAYGKLAEIIGQYLKKGSRAYFEGKLQTREWEKDGIKRYTTEIITNDMMMLDSRGEGAGMGGNAGFSSNAPSNAPMNQSPSAAMGGMAAGGFAQGAPAAQPGFNQQAPQQPAQQGGFQQQPAQQGGFQQQPAQQAPQQQGGFQPQQAPAQQPAQQPAAQPANNFDSFDDDIPF
jgi:single-strand DNA-binding protein